MPSGPSMKEDKLAFFLLVSFCCLFFYLFVCFINEVQRQILSSDVTITLHKRVLLVFVEAADTLFGYIKPCGVGGFESEGNDNAPVCAMAQVAECGNLVVLCLDCVAFLRVHLIT